MSKGMTPTYKPGQKAPTSGQYGVVGPKGGKTGTEVTVAKGGMLPPTRNLARALCWLTKLSTRVTINH